MIFESQQWPNECDHLQVFNVDLSPNDAFSIGVLNNYQSKLFRFMKAFLGGLGDFHDGYGLKI